MNSWRKLRKFREDCIKLHTQPSEVKITLRKAARKVCEEFSLPECIEIHNCLLRAMPQCQTDFDFKDEEARDAVEAYLLTVTLFRLGRATVECSEEWAEFQIQDSLEYLRGKAQLM